MAERSATRLGVAAAFAAIYLFWGGTLGVALLARGNGVWSGTLLDRLALIGSGLSWAIGSLIARDGARPSSAAQSTAMQLAAGGVAVLTLSLATGELAGWTVQQVTPRGAASLFFLVVAGTVLGFGAYTWLLRVSTPCGGGDLCLRKSAGGIGPGVGGR